MKRRVEAKSGMLVWVTAAISIAAHAVLLAVFLPPSFREVSSGEVRDSRIEEERPFRVKTTFARERVKRPEKVTAPKVIERAVVERSAEVVEPPEEPEDKPAKKEVVLDRKVVNQETNQAEPEEAEFLSEQANRVEEETRARETTTVEVEPGPPRDVVEAGRVEEEVAAEERSEMSEAVAMATQRRPAQAERAPRPPDRRRDEGDDGARSAEAEAKVAAQGLRRAERGDEASPRFEPKQVSPEALFGPSLDQYERVFREADERDESRLAEQRSARGRSILGDWREREQAVRGALENYIPEVRPGNHTSVNAKSAGYAAYVGRIHRKIHARWGAGFLPELDTRYGPGHPLRDPKLHIKLEFVIDAATGEVESINVVEASGELMYDAEAISVAYTVGPHPNPPAEVVSPDGKVYVHWNFWRDQRQCGTFGASVLLVE